MEMRPLTDEHAATLPAPAIEIRLYDAEPILAALDRLPVPYHLSLLFHFAAYDHRDIAATMAVNYLAVTAIRSLFDRRSVQLTLSLPSIPLDAPFSLSQTIPSFAAF